MKISTQEEGQPKQIFLTFKEAAASIGVPSPHIYAIIKRDNPRYKRRSDGKVFFFIKEETNGKLCTICGEDFKSFQQIKDRFGISPAVFLNQITRKKHHFNDSNEISHFVSDISPEMEKLIDGQKRMEMNKKIISENKDCQIKNNSYDVLNKKESFITEKNEIQHEFVGIISKCTCFQISTTRNS